MAEQTPQLAGIPPDDLDTLERTAQRVATQIGPHEGLQLHRFAKRLPSNAHVVTTGPCTGTLVYLRHASLTGHGVQVHGPNETETVAAVQIVVIGGDATYDHVRRQLERWWQAIPERGIIAFLDAQEHGVRALVEERLFHSPHIADIGYIGRMVYGRKVRQASSEDRRRNRRILKLWHAHIKLQRVKMPRPVRVAGREAMKWMQGTTPDPEPVEPTREAEQ